MTFPFNPFNSQFGLSPNLSAWSLCLHKQNKLVFVCIFSGAFLSLRPLCGYGKLRLVYEVCANIVRTPGGGWGAAVGNLNPCNCVYRYASLVCNQVCWAEAD